MVSTLSWEKSLTTGTCKLSRVDKERGLFAWQELSVPTETVLAPVDTQQLCPSSGLAIRRHRSGPRNISQEFI